MARCTVTIANFEADLSSPETRNNLRRWAVSTGEALGAAKVDVRFDIEGPNVQTLDLKRFEDEAGEEPAAGAPSAEEPAGTEGGDPSADQPPTNG